MELTEFEGQLNLVTLSQSPIQSSPPTESSGVLYKEVKVPRGNTTTPTEQQSSGVRSRNLHSSPAHQIILMHTKCWETLIKCSGEGGKLAWGNNAPPPGRALMGT